MWKIIVVLLLAAEILLLMQIHPVDARICVPIFREFKECQPENGEPPAWCGEYQGFWGRLRFGWQSFEEWVQDRLVGGVIRFP